MPGAAHIIEAELTWTGERFERGISVAVDAQGRIESVGPSLAGPAPRAGAAMREVIAMPDRALLPGFVNVHSHAFQRGLRGRGEHFPAGAGSFWTWREEMYRLVERMDRGLIHALSLQAFREMRAAGITTVGEFHYLHHDAHGDTYALDEAVLQAAREAGIRLVLLQTYYNTGGVGHELRGGQRRFRSSSPEPFWAQVDCLQSLLDPATQSLAGVVHSIRAAGVDDLVSVHEESTRRGMVFHIHVEEQIKEIEDCFTAYRRSPMGVILHHLPVNDRFTAVHCTHTNRDELEEFMGRGGNVCICPLSEANLGDGIAAIPAMLASGGAICLGSDSNARLCFTEEMRWLEYVQRLATRSRGVCVDEAGSVARRLLRIATVNGADALGLHAGRIEAECLADFIAIDLTAPQLEGWTDAMLLEALVQGTGDDAIAASCVGGQWRSERPHRST